ncbi:HAMP domain-containing histidine kinase [Myxococcus sp. AS-1-15]|nr:HAMP domain-containing histidine kinase [Myxococcus sp. AS-1-15]
MKMWQGLAWRTAIASLLLGLLATLSAAYVTFNKTAELAAQGSARLFSEAMMQAHGEACRAATQGWSHTFPQGLQVRAFDADRLLERGGPDPALVERLAAGESQPMSLHYPRLEGGVWAGSILIRAAASGPCSVLEYRWPVVASRMSGALWFMLAAITFTALLAAASTFAVISPLLKRVRRLHAAASGLGGKAYASTNDAARDELGDLSRVLDVAQARVQSDAARILGQQQALERFLSNVAHDLKTPIASLQLALELASSAPAEELPELLVRGLEDTVYLTALVDNLRLACQLGEGVDPLDGEPRAALGMLVERVARRLSLLARRKQLTLEVARPDHELWARCHPTMLEQAVSNLVHNAIAHGTPGGHVVAVLEEPAPERFRLTVLDDGPGVPPEDLGRLGERLFRASGARERDPRGSGLGVAIARELCQRAHLTLDFSRNEPCGLKVVLEGARVPAPS